MTAFDWVLGKWCFERIVTPLASANGSVRIERISETEAMYDERALVTLSTGDTVNGTQNYRYRKTETGFDIHFADTGLLFQSLSFRRDGDKLIATAMHDCARDRYVSEYVLYPDERMFVRHAVSGPARDYVSETTFRRIP